MSFDHNTSVCVPVWVPDDVRHYLMHTVYGQSIRQLARHAGCHASTVLRHVRKVEARRDDPLTDGALRLLSGGEDLAGIKVSGLEQLQALRRMAEPGAVLAVARDMEMGVIVREDGTDGAERAASLELRIAQVLALRDWIEAGPLGGRVTRYRITAQGRTGLRELIARSENRARELAEGPTAFRHKELEEAEPAKPQMRTMRLAAAESPVHALARRKDKSGQNFLDRDMVRAAERLREEFEIAHIGAGLTQDWSGFLTAGVRGTRAAADRDLSQMDARGRVEAAFEFLGQGLAEVVYRTCCLLDGLEATEQRMGWSARSGKIVLRIALQRLVLFYEGSGQFGPKIG